MTMSATGMRAGGSSTGMTPSLNVGKSKAGYRPASLSNYTPEQMGLLQRLFSHVGPDSYTARLAGGDQSLFDEIEAPAMRQFQGLQGNISSRFSGMGNGARKSSGFQNTINQASSDFASDLQSQRMGLQRNAIRDLMEMSNQLLNQRPYENFMIKQEPSGWKQFATNIGANIGQAAGTLGGIYTGKQFGLTK
jgi:hypothetical protein